MATRFYKNTQKENKAPPKKMEVAPDLDDLMDNWFFGGPVGVVEQRKNKEENVAVESASKKELDEKSTTTSSSTSRLTQEWLEEARSLVTNSGSRCTTPTRLVGSPRFASPARDSPSMLDRRDPLSRSARRHRISEGISSEILQKSSARQSLGEASSLPSSPSRHSSPSADPLLSPATPPPLPPKQRLPRRSSRFLNDPSPPSLSPPRNLLDSSHRRSVSSSTCSLDTSSVEPAAFRPRRSVDSAFLPRPRPISFSLQDATTTPAVAEDVEEINAFLRRQKAKLEGASNGELMAKAKAVLSRSSTSSVSSIVAAICYAWLLENKGDEASVVPVVNMRRDRMWKNKQAAWLFHHLGIDASSLLFADEVDLEGLIMSRQLTIVVVGQDVLKTNGEVGSHCTVLTDNYCEDAYNLLQAPNLKKLLLAGILLDTQNLNSAAKFFTNRDAEAVQLLLVGSSPDYRQELFEQLMQEHRSSSFLEAMKANYGEPPRECKLQYQK